MARMARMVPLCPRNTTFQSSEEFTFVYCTVLLCLLLLSVLFVERGGTTGKLNPTPTPNSATNPFPKGKHPIAQLHIPLPTRSAMAANGRGSATNMNLQYLRAEPLRLLTPKSQLTTRFGRPKWMGKPLTPSLSSAKEGRRFEGGTCCRRFYK